MKTRNLLFKTKKNVSNGLSKGQAVLEKGGFFYQTDVLGVYSDMPLGLLFMQNIEKIIDEELETSGFSKVALATLQSRQLWERSGRWEKYNATNTMYTATDGRGNEYALAPTAEESAFQLMEFSATSYNDLPILMQQTSTKYRNEIRPRGLTRGRAFKMNDAYSSHATLHELIHTFDYTLKAYNRIFERIGLPVIEVEADSGAIGGEGSTEVVHISPLGDDTILNCNDANCSYAANVEKANAIISKPRSTNYQKSYREVHTPNIKSVDQLCSHFDLDPIQMIKTVIFEVTGCPSMPFVAACIRGDLEINPTKLSNVVGALEVNPASEEDIKNLTGADVGFAGPINLELPVLFDESCRDLNDFLCGCNHTDHHAINVNFGAVLKIPENFFNLIMATDGMHCPSCSYGILESNVAIELGHCFQLGQGYSQQMGFTVIDEYGKAIHPYLGCYGIGVSRVAAVAAEYFAHSDKKMVLPLSIAPYQVAIIPVNTKNQVQVELANTVEKYMQTMKLSCLLEDRTVSFGKRIADHDLFGSPIRIIAGKLADQNIVEVHNLLIDHIEKVHLDDLPDVINSIVEQSLIVPTPLN
ncbi:MAG: prolyl-tRNA synthetase [Cocleimonas sp.]|jgi:prolyl-tRNA synthetase